MLPTPKRPAFRKSLMVLSPVLLAAPAVSPKSQITTQIAPKAPSGMLRLQGRVASIHQAAEKEGVLGNRASHITLFSQTRPEVFRYRGRRV